MLKTSAHIKHKILTRRPALFLFITSLIIQPVYGQMIIIDSVKITPPLRTVSLMDQPSVENLSLTPSISKISHNEFSRQGAVKLIDALNYIPGGLIETRGRQVKQFFSVRGQKYPYPDYAIDGVWQKEFEELPYFFSASDIEEIEIIRSSAALLTGLSGLTGLINIKTREYEGPETVLEMEYGTFSTLHTHLSHGNKKGNFSYAAGAGLDRTNGPGGRHASESMTDLNARIDWKLSDKLKLKANIFWLDGRREMAIAVPPADQRYIDMIQSFDPYRALLSNLKLIYKPSPKYSSEIQLLFSHRDPLFIDEVKGTTSNEKDYEFGINILQAVSLSRSNTLRFGGLYTRWIAPNGKRFYSGKRCDTETISAVVTDEQQIGDFTLDAGMRINRTFLNEYAAFNIEGDGAAFRNVTPLTDTWEPFLVQGSLGVSYKISESFSAYLANAAGQLKPRTGTLTDEMTVPLNEFRLKSDLGLIKKLPGSGKITAAFFTVLQKNAIVLSGSTFLDPETNIRRELYINRDQKQVGLELDIISPSIYKSIRTFFNFTYMSSFMEDAGELILNRENPRLISSAGFYSDFRKFDLNVFAKYVSAFENNRFVSVAAGPQPLGAFITTDLNAGYTFSDKNPSRLYLKVKNLANLKYSTVNGYPDFGRMIFLGIEMNFGK